MTDRIIAHPAWITDEAPDRDVVLSTRTRLMRNLAGFRFPGKAPPGELATVFALVRDAALAEGWSVHANLTTAERDRLLGTRLISPEFEWTHPSRAVALSPDGTGSLMINEEDHLRLQIIRGGLQVQAAGAAVSRASRTFERHLAFAWSPRYGYLAASVYNTGAGRRQSAMFHLIGLASGKRLATVIRALNASNIMVRGLFGESSRAVGAFVQVSAVGDRTDEFAGACEYLKAEERSERAALGPSQLLDSARRAYEVAMNSRSLSAADTVRVLAWVRWGAHAGASGFTFDPVRIDELLTQLELHPGDAGDDPNASGIRRADQIRRLWSREPTIPNDSPSKS